MITSLVTVDRIFSMELEIDTDNIKIRRFGLIANETAIHHSLVGSNLNNRTAFNNKQTPCK